MMTIQVPNVSDIKTYRKQKIKMLENDFKVRLTKEEKEHFDTLDNEIAIDRYAKSILRDRWD